MLVKGVPTEVGTYLGRFILDSEQYAIYKVVYLDKNYGLLLAPDDSYMTHYLSIDSLECNLNSRDAK